MPEPPVLLYDGECGFCTRIVARWQQQLGERIVAASFQERRADFPELDETALAEAVHLVEPSGDVRRGADAVFRTLELDPLWGWTHAVYRIVPGAAGAAERVYRLVADHRVAASRISGLLWGPSLHEARYRFSRRAFLSMLGAIFTVAFVSAGVQVAALIGPAGISPASDWFGLLEANDVTRLQLPSVFWWGASDAALVRVCVAGAILGGVLTVGVAQKYVLPPLVFLYLSLVNAGGVFFGYQWDTLLIETGFFAIFFAGWWPIPRPGGGGTVSSGARFLLKVLLFKLMFLSGWVKWAGADEVWRDLSALDFHYWTQPIPTVGGWWAAQLPLWLQKISTLAMFFVELVVPFFIFAPRRLRHIAAVLLIGLQVLIGITGNYNFFGLLTIALCLPLLDDELWRFGFHRLFRMQPRSFPLRRPHLWRRAAFALVVAPFLFLSLVQMHVTVRTAKDRCQPVASPRPPHWTAPFLRAGARWKVVNTYGLFTCMTTERPEITLEGSSDGQAWKPYRFRWKLDDDRSRPRFVQPHQPRVDWQMWFSGLRSRCSPRDPWFLQFQARLLEGHEPVLALLEENPFPGNPPRFLRASVRTYRPASIATRRREGVWWVRDDATEYCPMVELVDGGLRPASATPLTPAH